MSHTHTCLLYHIVFSTKHREPWLTPDIRAEVFSYLAGSIKGQGGTPILINGVSDHVHILTGLRSKQCPAELVGEMKSNSTSWFHERFNRSAFSWQEGYGAFTVSPQHRQHVRAYISNQEEHHRKRSFQEEYLHMLKVAEVEYDPRFVFD